MSKVQPSDERELTWENRKTPYEKWVLRQGVPVVEGYGVTDPSEQKFGFWNRIGADAYFVIMKGMEGITGQYAVRLKAGRSTNWERHLYEKVIYVAKGLGATTVEDSQGKRHHFEWQHGSVFAIPLNARHSISAVEPSVYVAWTTAPMVFDLFYDEKFVYDNPYWFRDRFNGEADYFSKETRIGKYWETNFIADVTKARIDPSQNRGPDVNLSMFEIANNSLICHLARWPAGRYMLAHYHGGGAVLQIVQGEGFTLMWSNAYGEQPYESGYGDKVVRVDWKVGSSFSPPTNWYHQHFNTGRGDALQLALRNGSNKNPLGVRHAHNTAMTSGIPLEREDPAIRKMYEEAVARKGGGSTMPAVARWLLLT